MKPRSSIWSASSTTRISTPPSERILLLDEVEEPSRRRDQDVDAALQRSGLRALRNAAEDDRDVEPEPRAVGAEALRDLARKLTRRGEHEHARSARNARRVRGGEALEDRKREGRRLAGAGLRDAAKVAAGEDRGDCLRLDRGRDAVAFIGDGAKNGFAQGEIGKLGQWVLSV